MAVWWWEKTVEYLFIQKHINQDLTIAPLDGNHEKKLADGIVGDTDRLILIEFKRYSESIKDEEKKFFCFKEAKEACADYDEKNVHFIIYGQAPNDKLELTCQTYFEGRVVNIDDALKGGLKQAAFNKYLELLVAYKKDDSDGGLSGFGTVTAISGGGRIDAFSLDEYLHKNKNNLHSMPEEAPQNTRRRTMRPG